MPTDLPTSPTPAPIDVRTLGELRVTAGGAPVEGLRGAPVRCALFLYLALERTATRDALTALLWPERSAARARHSLSQALYELRRALGAEWLTGAGDPLRVSERVRVDALGFLAADEAGRTEEAFAAFTGPFLPGVHLAASAPFEAWSAARGAELLRRFRGVCRRLAAARAEAGDVDGALDAAFRWAAADPLDDEANHRVVELLAAAGRRAEALRAYEEYAARLAAELEVEPLGETRLLAERLRAAEAAPGPAALAGPPPSLAPLPFPARRAGDARRRRAAGVVLAGAALAAALLALPRALPAPEGSPPPEGGDRGAARDFLARGREYLNRPGEADVRKFGPAVALFRRALDEDPGSAAAYAGISEAFRAQVGLPPAERRDSALHYARLAARAAPGDAGAEAALAWAHLVARGWDSAGAALDRALAADSLHPEALAGRARLEAARGRMDAAVRWQQRAAAADPASARHLSNLGAFLMDVGDLAGAEDAFRRSAALAPDAPVPSYLLAQVHLVRGDDAAADRVMEALARAAAGHPGAEFLLARYRAQRGDARGAAAELARLAPLLDGVAATVTLQRAYAALRAGDHPAAEALLARAEAELDAQEAAGFPAPRLRMQLAALRGDAAGAAAALASRWREAPGGDLLAGPQLGLYWIDRDPLLERVREAPPFRAVHDSIRGEMDRVRARLGRG